MKKVILAMVMMMSSVCGFAQNVYVGGYPLSMRWHTNKECSELKGHDVKIMPLKKAKFHYFGCSKCGKEELVEVVKDTIPVKVEPINHIQLSGEYLKKSSQMRYAAYGCAVAGGVVALIGETAVSKDSSFRKNHIGLYACGAFAAAGIICDLVSIHYNYKAGQSLTIGAGKITYNF